MCDSSDMATSEALVKVATDIDAELNEQLEIKRKAADRSKAAEIRQAIRAWVGDDREPLEKASAARGGGVGD